MALAKEFPHLRFCVQDRPKVVEHGIAVSRFSSPYVGILTRQIKAWKERCPGMLESGKAVFQGCCLTSLRRTVYLSTLSSRLFYSTTRPGRRDIPITSNNPRLAR